MSSSVSLGFTWIRYEGIVCVGEADLNCFFALTPKRAVVDRRACSSPAQQTAVARDVKLQFALSPSRGHVCAFFSFENSQQYVRSTRQDERIAVCPTHAQALKLGASQECRNVSQNVYPHTQDE